VGFFPKGDKLWASFQKGTKDNGTNVFSFGIIEIPLSDAPVREITLIKGLRTKEQDLGFYFQAAMSHDGKTAAVASTYLACLEEFKPEDCALFLVDLSDPNRKVTKVPITMPARRPATGS
jgi:hypothetical protein